MRAREASQAAAAAASNVEETQERRPKPSQSAANGPPSPPEPRRPPEAVKVVEASSRPAKLATAGASSGPVTASNIEAVLLEILQSHDATREQPFDLQRMAQELAAAGDMRRPPHVAAALRRGLAEASPQRLTFGPLMRLLRKYVERASENDMPQASPEREDRPAAKLRQVPDETPEQLAEYRRAALEHGPKLRELLAKIGDPNAGPRPFVPRPGVAR